MTAKVTEISGINNQNTEFSETRGNLVWSLELEVWSENL
jgi:hypothetical protein